MKQWHCVTLTLSLLCTINVVMVPTSDADTLPWGSAKSLNVEYQPQKVVYDVVTGNAEQLSILLDRLGLLYRLYGSDPLDSSIIVILHGDAIPYFAIDKYREYEDLMNRAQSLTVGTTIEFRMCEANAKLLNLEPKDIHGFVKMVPMADAELVRLQLEEGYGYMR